MLLPLIWAACAVVIIRAALRSKRHPDALRTGRLAVGVLYIVAGAAVNVFFLLRGDDYAQFADGSYIPFVRDTWRDLVVPHHAAWIGLLIAFELAVGVLAPWGAAAPSSPTPLQSRSTLRCCRSGGASTSGRSR